jgi:hypothetical protein
VSPLTISYRRAEVIAFWVVGTAVAWLFGLVAATAMELRPSWLWGVATAVTAIAPGAFWSPWFETGIWLWNGTVRRFATLLKSYTLAVSYYTLFAAVGASRSTRAGGAGSSGWMQRDHALTTSNSGPRGEEWARAIGLFARAPGRTWAVTLLPLVALLRMLGHDEQAARVSGSSYTLY